MKIAFISSNIVKLSRNTKKGSEILNYILLNHFRKIAKKEHLNITVFASGNSQIPFPIESVSYQSSLEQDSVGMEHHKMYEVALLLKAIAMQKNFDLFHMGLGVGELILPFVNLIRKPIVVTMHGDLNSSFVKKFFSIYQNQSKIPHFVSISNIQRKPIPSLPYIKTIYHGINQQFFAFSPLGGNCIMWAGRAVPEKGLETVLSVIKKTKKQAKIFPIIKEEYLNWLHEMIIKKRNIINQTVKIYIDFDVHRYELPTHYQTSKLFLFPLEWEEPFGLTLVESLSCGTPVVAYARGSVPEIIKDGENGYIVNSSENDIRGNWIVKKTGIEGLSEAVERIYALSAEEYKKMRENCRTRVEKNFTASQMASEYVKLYKSILCHNLPPK